MCWQLFSLEPKIFMNILVDMNDNGIFLHHFSLLTWVINLYVVLSWLGIFFFFLVCIVCFKIFDIVYIIALCYCF